MLERLAQDPRVTVRRRGELRADGAAVVYWMQRAQRAWDNPALDIAIEAANLLHRPVVVFFGLHPFVERANLRHYRFLADGLPDLAAGLRRRRVGFVLRAHPSHRLLPFLEDVVPCLVVGDENPLRQQEGWRERVAEEVKAPLWTVDADVVVPTRLIEAEQYAARTIRPRIHRHLDEFLVPSAHPAARVPWKAPRAVHTLAPGADILAGLPIDDAVGPVRTLTGGLREARRHLRRFVRARLTGYDTGRNHPEIDGTSQLSPYLHFGQIGPREVALAVREAEGPAASTDAFLEQLIVRRELAVNFVRYNEHYDRLDGCERWARRTLNQHRHDRREHLYTEEQFEAAETHDALWNAAQRQMVDTGWMHGYVRMYWAKKILEWTPDAATAHAIAIRLNDRYELDGRDPNGYTNIAWAICGKHDRPWPTRPIYGAIRSMSQASTSRKFDTERYIARYGARSESRASRSRNPRGRSR